MTSEAGTAKSSSAGRDRTKAHLACAVVAASVIVLAAMSVGCSAPQMKGTPFFSGDYEMRQGSVEDRVNLWPAVYYRDPALSVLWPIGQATDDYVAVRPLFSVYKLQDDRPEVSVLWPVSDLDFDEREYRAFPAFWGAQDSGEPYAVLFPAAWYIPGHFSGVVPVFWTDDMLTVLPLYYQGLGGDAADDWAVLFPLVWYDRNEHASVFPLVVHYWRDEGYSTHAPWPLVNVKAGEGESGWRLWPLYGHYHNPEEETERRYALWPLAVSMRDGKTSTRWAAPLYAGRDGPSYQWDLLFPVYYGSSSPRQSSTFIAPSFYRSRSGEEEQSLLFPLFYRWTDGESSLFLTPPGGISESPGETNLYAFPLLSSYSAAESDRDLWMLFPLARVRWAEQLRESHVFPLYYWGSEDNLFISLPLSYRNAGNEGFAMLLGPVGGYTWGADGWAGWFPLGLAGVGGGREGETSRHWALPFYIYSGSEEGTFLNLGLPLFTYSSSPNETSIHYLWPLGKAESEERGSTNRLLPLWYYWNDAEAEESFLNLAGLLLNYWSSPDETEFYTALPPAGARWEEDGDEHALWPLYFYGRGEETRQLHLGPFLPFDGGPGARRVCALTGYKDREDGHSLWMFPFYDGSWTEHTWWREDGQWMKGREHVHRSVGFPFWIYESDRILPESAEPTDDKRKYIPEQGKPGDTTDLDLLLFLANYDSYSRQRGEGGPAAERSFNLLWRLYDYTKEVTPKEEDPSARDVYVRHRILWRAMHYERVNDYSTLDLFPGITWDSKPGEKKTVSFLWRFLRYEWNRDEGTTFYFMFIPF